MERANRYGAFGIKFTGDVTINGPMIDIHDNGRVYVHTEKMGSTVDQECDEEWEAVRLKFFDMKKYGSDKKQQQLREVGVCGVLLGHRAADVRCSEANQSE